MAASLLFVLLCFIRKSLEIEGAAGREPAPQRERLETRKSGGSLGGPGSLRQVGAGLQHAWAGVDFGRRRVPSFVAAGGKERRGWMRAGMLRLEGNSLSSVCACEGGRGQVSWLQVRGKTGI